MINFIQPGKTLTVTAGGAIVAGTPYVVGALVGIAGTSAANTEQYELALEGVFKLPKKANLVVALGDKLYWDADPGEITGTKADGVFIGYGAAAALAAGTTVNVLLARIGDDA